MVHNVIFNSYTDTSFLVFSLVLGALYSIILAFSMHKTMKTASSHYELYVKMLLCSVSLIAIFRIVRILEVFIHLSDEVLSIIIEIPFIFYVLLLSLFCLILLDLYNSLLQAHQVRKIFCVKAARIFIISVVVFNFLLISLFFALNSPDRTISVNLEVINGISYIIFCVILAILTTHIKKVILERYASEFGKEVVKNIAHVAKIFIFVFTGSLLMCAVCYNLYTFMTNVILKNSLYFGFFIFADILPQSVLIRFIYQIKDRTTDSFSESILDIGKDINVSAETSSALNILHFTNNK